jgi:hypothetical protein
MVLSGVGADNLTIYAFNVDGGPLFEFGNFTGDANSFLAEVSKSGDDCKRAQCLGFVGIVTSVWYPEKLHSDKS